MEINSWEDMVGTTVLVVITGDLLTDDNIKIEII